MYSELRVDLRHCFVWENSVALDVKQAVAAALSFVTSVYGQDLEGLRLEEISFDDQQQHWLVTIGYWDMIPQKSPLAQLSNPLHKRVYKVVRLTKSDGEVVSMKIRE